MNSIPEAILVRWHVSEKECMSRRAVPRIKTHIPPRRRECKTHTYVADIALQRQCNRYITCSSTFPTHGMIRMKHRYRSNQSSITKDIDCGINHYKAWHQFENKLLPRHNHNLVPNGQGLGSSYMHLTATNFTVKIIPIRLQTACVSESNEAKQLAQR